MDRTTIEAAIHQLEANGQPVTGNKVHVLVGGSRAHVLQLYKEVRGALVGTGTGILEEEPEEERTGSEEASITTDSCTENFGMAVSTAAIFPDWTAANSALAQLRTAQARQAEAEAHLAEIEEKVKVAILDRQVLKERRALGLLPAALRKGPYMPEADSRIFIDLQQQLNQAIDRVAHTKDRIPAARDSFHRARRDAIAEAQRQWLLAQYPALAASIQEAEALCAQVPDSPHARAVAMACWDVLMQHREECPDWSQDGPQEN